MNLGVTNNQIFVGLLFLLIGAVSVLYTILVIDLVFTAPFFAPYLETMQFSSLAVAIVVMAIFYNNMMAKKKIYTDLETGHKFEGETKYYLFNFRTEYWLLVFFMLFLLPEMVS